MKEPKLIIDKAEYDRLIRIEKAIEDIKANKIAGLKIGEYFNSYKFSSIYITSEDVEKMHEEIRGLEKEIDMFRLALNSYKNIEKPKTLKEKIKTLFKLYE